MEKIYIEENQKNNKRKKFRSSTSVMLSFILAFVAIISLIAYGFGQISFAIPDESISQVPDTIVTGSEADNSNKIRGQIATQQIAIHHATINGTSKLVFCIESEKDIASNSTYTKKEEISDVGLIFLLNALLSDDAKIVDSNGVEVNEKVKGWLIQTAIWIYQKNVGAANNATIGIGDGALAINEDNVKAEKTLFTMADFTNAIITSTTPLYDACTVNYEGVNLSINKVLEMALNYHNTGWSFGDIKISKKSDTVSLTSDEKYYQSDLITVTSSTGGFLGYKIDLSKAPEGSYLIDTNNNKIEDLDNITEGRQFYVRVPVDKITEENKNFPIQVTGAYKGNIGYKYVSGEYQAITYTGLVTKHISNGLDLSFNYTPDVPDTSITTAQSIYFVGLIILLAGVGIIYANVRPIKEN